MRPALHFTAQRGWINDPHAITFHDGRYHLFHQFVPDSMVHDPACRWGHATSTDLLSWRHRPVALEPGDGDDGIWTGSLALSDDGPVILYTSVRKENYDLGRVRRAVPADAAWDTWIKEEVVVPPPDDPELRAFRDPFVLREGDHWRFLIGAATHDGRAQARTYVSRDLREWQDDGIALERSTEETEPVWMGRLWECPQVVEIDGAGHWAMVSSIWDNDVLHYAGYAVGTFSHGRFSPAVWGRLSFGASYYAPSVFTDAEGLPCLMFWMRGVQDPEDGWASCLSVPFRIGGSGDNLSLSWHPELSQRFGPEEPIEQGAAVSVEGPLLMTWAGGSTGRLDLGGTTVHRDEHSVTLDVPGRSPQSIEVPAGAVDVLVDGPVVEILAAGKVLGGPVPPADWLTVHGGTPVIRRWPERDPR